MDLNSHLEMISLTRNLIFTAVKTRRICTSHHCSQKDCSVFTATRMLSSSSTGGGLCPHGSVPQKGDG